MYCFLDNRNYCVSLAAAWRTTPQCAVSVSTMTQQRGRPWLQGLEVLRARVHFHLRSLILSPRPAWEMRLGLTRAKPNGVSWGVRLYRTLRGAVAC